MNMTLFPTLAFPAKAIFKSVPSDLFDLDDVDANNGNSCDGGGASTSLLLQESYDIWYGPWGCEGGVSRSPSRTSTNTLEAKPLPSAKVAPLRLNSRGP